MIKVHSLRYFWYKELVWSGLALVSIVGLAAEPS